MVEGTMTAIFNSDGKMLIAKRSPNKKIAPNRWNLIGGRIEPNEKPEYAAIREVFEETQIKLSPDDLSLFAENIQHWDRKHKFFCYTYIAHSNNTPQLNQEHSEFKFVSLNEALDANIVGYTKEEIELLFLSN